MPRRNKADTRNGQKGPRFTQYFAPVLEALKNLGGPGRPSEVDDYILKNHPDLAGPAQMEILQTGVTRFNKDIHFARFFLAKYGLVSSSQRGVWSLTEAGANAAITPTVAVEIFQ
jgi:restriction system protein